MKSLSKLFYTALFLAVASVPSKSNAQISLDSYYNIDWQFNIPLGNSFSDDGIEHLPALLENLMAHVDNTEIQERFMAVKKERKAILAALIKKETGIEIDTNSIIDVQAKRLHAYKRQLLNALNIIGLYLDLKENPDLDMQPQTFIFGAKAAPGYDMAKRIIKLLCMISKDIDQNPKIKEKLNVVFLENYSVSMAEALIPSAEISEQISLASSATTPKERCSIEAKPSKISKEISVASWIFFFNSAFVCSFIFIVSRSIHDPGPQRPRQCNPFSRRNS